jgi:hypothetical protein
MNVLLLLMLCRQMSCFAVLAIEKPSLLKENPDIFDAGSPTS